MAQDKAKTEPLCMAQYFRVLTTYRSRLTGNIFTASVNISPRAPGLEVDQQLSSGEGSKEEEWVVVARRGRWWTVTVKEAGR